MSRRKVGRQVELELIADDEVDPGLMFEPFYPRLGVAARERDKGVGRMLERLANQISRCPLSFFCHRTGIENEQVRGLAEFDQSIPFLPESLAKNRRFSLIQPASQRMKRRAGV